MTAQRDPDFDLEAVLSADDGAGAAADPAGLAPGTLDRPSSQVDERRDRMRRAIRRARDAGQAMLGYRGVPVALFALPVIVAAVVTFTAEPVYEARARVLLEPRARRIVPFRQVTDEAARLSADLWSEGVQSGAFGENLRGGRERVRVGSITDRVSRRELARRTIEDLDLWDVFAGSGRIRQSEASPPADPRERAVRSMLRSVRFVPLVGTRIVELGFRSSDPALSQDIANGLAGSFIALSMEARLDRTRESADWLDERLRELREDVLTAEAALRQFVEEPADVHRGSGGLAARRLLDVNAALTDARTARIEQEVLHRQLTELPPDASMMDAFPSVFGDAGVQREKASLQAMEQEEAGLATSLGDRHPRLLALRRGIEDAERRLQAGMEVAIERVRQRAEAARTRERDLAAALAREQAGVLAADRDGIRLGLLQADVRAARHIYEIVLRRRDQVQHAAALSITGMRVVDPAELPTRPLAPPYRRNLSAGAVAGAVLGLLAFYLANAARSLASPERVRRRLGQTTLASLPFVAPHGEASPRIAPLTGGATPFTEEIRRLRTNLQFAAADNAGRVILVTSTEPGEGKSTVAAYLASALAESGERVLLVDADMRRPSVHDVFDVPCEPGLSQVLCGLASAEQGIRRTEHESLRVLPAGRVPPNPSELLLSQRFQDLLVHLAEGADRIVIDAPPILAVTDGAIAGRNAEGVVFVIDPARTSPRRAVHALDALRQVRAQVLGVVINRAVQHAAAP